CPSHSPHTELGGFRPSHVYRNSLLRRIKHPDCSTITRLDNESHEYIAGGTPCCFAARIESPRSDARKILHLSRGSGTGANRGFTGARSSSPAQERIRASGNHITGI